MQVPTNTFASSAVKTCIKSTWLRTGTCNYQLFLTCFQLLSHLIQLSASTRDRGADQVLHDNGNIIDTCLALFTIHTRLLTQCHAGNVIHIIFRSISHYPELPRETHHFLKMAHDLHEAVRRAVHHLVFKALSAGQQ